MEHVFIKLEPMEAGDGYELLMTIQGGVIPKEYIPAVKQRYPRGYAKRYSSWLPCGGM